MIQKVYSRIKTYIYIRPYRRIKALSRGELYGFQEKNDRIRCIMPIYDVYRLRR